MSDNNIILKDKEFMNWLVKNFFYFMKKEVIIDKYMFYLKNDVERLRKLYEVYKDSN